MIRLLIQPLIVITDGIIILSTLFISVLGLTRFFLVHGANLRYIAKRKHWYETSMLGTKTRFSQYLSFGLWACSSIMATKLKQ